MAKWSVTIKGKKDVRLRGSDGRMLAWPVTLSVSGPAHKADAEAAALHSLNLKVSDTEACEATLVT